jgi:demethylmenaquinone methyltransferase/2-methoxy-6-polyprenyl-1,4-benzoquinol methylase
MHTIRIQIPDFAEMKPGDRALDVCCGTGALVLHYAKRGIIADGIDLNPRAIEVAENKSDKLNFRYASFQTGNALNLPFDENMFDHASISMSLHEKERVDRDRVISEMKRVVKMKGNLIFIDYRMPLPPIPVSTTVQVIEFIAGRDHWRCFNDYVKQGGLDELLKRNSLRQYRRMSLGPFAIIKTPNA